MASVTRPPLVFVGGMRGDGDVASAVEGLLAAAGVPAAQLARLGAYYDPAAFPTREALVDALAAALPDAARPALGAVPVPGAPTQLEAVGSVDPVVPLGDGRFADAVLCRDVLFTSAVLAPSPEGDVAAQSERVLDRLAAILGEAGVALDDACKLNIFYVGGGTAEDWEVAARVRARYFSEPGPAATGIPVASLGEPGALISMELIALRDGSVPRSYSWPEGHWDWPIHLPWKHGNAASGMAWVGGQVALTPEAEVLEPDDLEAQSRIAVDNIERVLAELGFSLSDLVELTAFAAGRPDRSRRVVPLEGDVALTEVWLPFLAYERMVVEIEATAMRSVAPRLPGAPLSSVTRSS